ncbi:MAG: hypothetical protein AAB480_02580 [Patescibacteria group bacterium]
MIPLSHSSKQTVAIFVVIAFLMLALFSFAVMIRGADGAMQGDCPFSVMGASLCSQDAFATVTHHISAYLSFLNVSFGFRIVSVLVAALLFVLSGIIIRMGSPHIRGVADTARRFYPQRPLIPRNDNALRWLSLFEHSPSF